MLLLIKLILGLFYLLQDLAKSTFGQGSNSASEPRNAPVPKAKKLLDEAYAVGAHVKVNKFEQRPVARTESKIQRKRLRR